MLAGYVLVSLKRYYYCQSKAFSLMWNLKRPFKKILKKKFFEKIPQFKNFKVNNS